MEAIIKLKRHANDDPIEALVLSCKRRKIDFNVESNKNLTVLRFAGTVKEQDDVIKHISYLRKEESNKLIKSSVPDILEKARKQTKETSLKNRYKIVNCFRALNDLDSSQADLSNDKTKNCTILEVENEEKKDESDFVYDLYYTHKTDLNVSLENELSIHPLEDELIVNGEQCTSSDSETDDSNDESNWRNDYPDSDINEDDMMNAMQGMNLGEGDRDLSSDDEEEGFIYSVDSEASGFHEDIDESDVMRYGEMYARFKARSKHLYDDIGIDRDLFNDENSENEGHSS